MKKSSGKRKNIGPAESETKVEALQDGHRPTRSVWDGARQAHQAEKKTSAGENRTAVTATSASATSCPYCESTDFVKRGTRHNKFGEAQLYICRNPLCGRTFTAKDSSLGENLGRLVGKKYPLKIVIECMSHYNLGFTFEQTCSIVKQKFGAAPDAQTASAWYEEYKPLCRYERLRPYAVKYCKPIETVEVVTMAHRQMYRFRYHRAKTYLMLEEFRNRNLKPLKEYLDSVSTETPHQYFSEGGRMSEIKSKFDKADMIVKSKTNFANHLAEFVLPSVAENKHRHEELQRFFIANDSVTVATEVPVYIRREDVEHMENVLKFKVTGLSGAEVDSVPTATASADIATPARGGKRQHAISALEPPPGFVMVKGSKRPIPFPRILTGHIDFVQIRNGCVHLLDYKPNASKEQPIEQLTWYAMAMSRLTGLRLFEFKCGWFDEKDYFEFYPLHVVKKLNYKRKRNVVFKDGRKVEVPREVFGKAEVV
ncbi:MAG: hypothetical protein COV91_00360 [Candidatus Taylorbacteria bacterium CG11_big_fil_rev_8_21_14_0_20_46_11]|uniref:PD-(D/E)XK endonuclease-like domain-containing protein n=1 Tax=Candidatus Taylorbacteria bacterium CG11_big_fil_rev_8_21_14_0_20_46_11 TaxID=1975025 RepID=A0A2H0KD46_9BACT|nr:MAG: hypothetical protein COV91_00360 [Candidatus Taylorbacteria bacterium CG11_big_fil_rev_8_21_14_0_20_46_11]